MIVFCEINTVEWITIHQPKFLIYNNNKLMSSRASRSALPDKRTRTIVSFRQYLLPKSIGNVNKGKQNNYQIHPDILSAIADQSHLDPDLNFVQWLIKLYRKVGFVLIPQNPVLVCWQVVLFLIINYYILQTGLLFGFGSAFWQDELTYLFGLQIAFILVLSVDIVLSPLKAFYDEGLVIKDVSIILKNYGRFQFWIDLLAVISIIIPLAVGNVNSNWIKLVWFLKLYSISNIISNFERLTQLYIIPNTIFLVLKLTLYAYLYSHYLGIFFYRISLSIYESNYYGPNTPNIVWIYNSWAFYQMAFLPWYQMYVYIMYFCIAFITTIAYGDITPKNPLQCIYIIFALVFQTILWGYILSQILRLLINVYSYNFTRRYHHYSLNAKLKQSLIPEMTFKKVQMHTQEIDRDQRFRNREIQDEILELLPPDPLYGVELIIYKNYLYQIGFQFVRSLSYKSLGPADKRSMFLQSFMRGIREVRFFAGDILYEQGEIEGQRDENHAAYCFTDSKFSQSVVLGVGEMIKIQIKTQQAKHVSNVRSFQLKRPKATFGQVQFLTGEERSHWAICAKNCLLFETPRRLIQQNYHLLTVEEKQFIKLSQEKAKERSCFICRKRHQFKKCPYTFVSKEKLDMSAKANRFPKNRQQDRTRLKTLSSWRIFTSIRDIKMKISKSYKDRQFYDKSALQLFVQLELQQNCQEQLDQLDLEHELFQTQVIIDSIYRQELQQLGLSQEQWSYDRVYSYSYYKPANNVEQVSIDIEKRRQAKNSRRNANKY